MSVIRGASVFLIASSIVLSACGHARGSSEPVYVEGQKSGFHLWGHGKKADPNGQGGIGVNSYLWRATLDTLSFMPMNSADPWGGVIITDWYSSPEKPDERFKTTVYILDTRLRADALNVSVFKQVRDSSGNWVDSTVSAQTEQDIENSILTRARQLRLANVGSS